MIRNIILILTAVLLTGCFQRNEIELTPKETLESFYSSLFTGDFSKAESLCEVCGMGEYIERFHRAWEKPDSAVTAMLPVIMSEIVIEIVDIRKSGQHAEVNYRLTSPDGTTIEKTAAMGKQEGIWKITAITDRL